MNIQNELNLIQEWDIKFDSICKLGEAGKGSISALADYIKAIKTKYDGLKFLTTEETKEHNETQLILEFLTIKVVIRAEIPLSTLSSGDNFKGKINAYFLPEKETDKPTQLKISFIFDEQGNVKERPEGWLLAVKTFPFPFLRGLIDELFTTEGLRVF